MCDVADELAGIAAPHIVQLVERRCIGRDEGNAFKPS